jgi:D-alanyl-D-alanine carboxypeptidase
LIPAEPIPRAIYKENVNMKFQKRKCMLLFILPLLCIVGLLASGILWAGKEMNDRRVEMADFILANPATTAVVAYTADEKGELVDDSMSIFRNADAPLVVGSTMKILVLAAYADSVVRGEINPVERVPVADWEQYYLPGTDGGAHKEALASLGLAAKEDGFAADASAEVTLGDLVRAMIHYSGNAETDYLLDRLGSERMATTLAGAGMATHDPIRPILGVALRMCNVDDPAFLRYGLGAAIRDGKNQQYAKENALMVRYLTDDAWRLNQIQFLQSGGCAKDAGVFTWDQQTEASELFPKGTAREYARLMAQIAAGRLFSPEASRIMQEVLESVPSNWPVTLLFHNRFGAKDGMTAGVLSLASYAKPMRGPAAGLTRIVVIVINRMPLDIWQRQAEWEGVYLLQTDLAEGSGASDSLRGS